MRSFRSLFGDVKQTEGISEFSSFTTNAFFSLLTFGTKPKNWNSLNSKPERVNAVSTLEGPGIDIILKLLIIKCRIKSFPGSEIRGVPASDIKATFFPLVRAFSISAIFIFSFPTKYDFRGVVIEKFSTSFLALRVSSQ